MKVSSEARGVLLWAMTALGISVVALSSHAQHYSPPDRCVVGKQKMAAVPLREDPAVESMLEETVRHGRTQGMNPREVRELYWRTVEEFDRVGRAEGILDPCNTTRTRKLT